MKHLFFEVATKPVPKGRPRFARGRVFTPSTTKNFEKLIHVQCGLAMTLQKFERLTGPVEVFIEFQYKRPKKTELSCPRADIDNLVKAVLDGINGIAFDDDKQVQCLFASKNWGEADLITVKVMPL